MGCQRRAPPLGRGLIPLDALARSIRHGAPSKDAIPAIDHPRFVAASQARFLADEDVVFGLVR
ncbi:MAG TPA: hypothetical protein VIV12_17490, partial [Streptosporangiaceae bacterium]